MMGEMERKKECIKRLFTAFGKADDALRMLIYLDVIKNVPASCLEKAVWMLERKDDFLPSAARLLKTARKIYQKDAGLPAIPGFWQIHKEIVAAVNRGGRWYVGCLGGVSLDNPDIGKPCAPMWSCQIAEKMYQMYADDIKHAKTDDKVLESRMRKTYDDLLDDMENELVERAVEEKAMRTLGGYDGKVSCIEARAAK